MGPFVDNRTCVTKSGVMLKICFNVFFSEWAFALNYTHYHMDIIHNLFCR